jgi:hypothetical protein
MPSPGGTQLALGAVIWAGAAKRALRSGVAVAPKRASSWKRPDTEGTVTVWSDGFRFPEIGTNLCCYALPCM